MSIPRLIMGQTAVLVVDVQERLMAQIHEAGRVAEQVGRLVDIAAALGLPLLVSEQYPQGLGPTIPEIAAKIDAAGSYVDVFRQQKLKFSACVEAVRDKLAALHARTVLVCGVEAHVCVLQTCLDLAEAGLTAAVVADAVGSRRAVDCQTALARLTQAGIVPTTVESAALELLHEAGGEGFKAILPLIK